MARDLLQALRGLLARGQDLGPLGCRAHRGVDPQREVVIAAVTFCQRHQLVDGREEIGRADLGRGDLGGHLGEKPGHQGRVLERHRVNQQVTQGTGLGAAQHLEGGAGILRADLDGPLAARLGLEAMGLVDHPVAHRRQDPSLGRHVAKQQRVVGHHHIGRGGTAARAV